MNLLSKDYFFDYFLDYLICFEISFRTFILSSEKIKFYKLFLIKVSSNLIFSSISD